MNTTFKGEWVYVVSGIWRLACNVVYGGSRFDVLIPGFGWCVACDEQPPKHTQRRMLKRVFSAMP